MNPEIRLPKNDPSRSNQRGYSLIELSIVLVITTGVLLGLFSIYQFKQATDKAELIAGQYKRINLAVSGYLSQNSDALLKLLDTKSTCSDINWRASTNGVQGVTVNPDPTGCELRDAKGNILTANGAQPTLDELRTLRFLDTTTPATVPMNTQQVMVANASSANQFVPSRFAVQITRTCVQHAGAVASAASYLNCSTTSTTGYWDLSSLVFNNQPFTEEAIFTSRGINLMNLIFNAAGTDALIAGRGVQAVTNANGVDITNQFPLIAANRSAREFVANPLRDPAGNGVANVLAMRGGYQSSLFLNSMRVDGGTRPTNDWNFAGFNVTDIGSLGVNKDIAASNDIRASNRIFAGKAGDPNCDVSSNQHAGGAGDVNACRDMVAKGWVKGLETVVAGPNNDIGVRLNRDGSIQGKTLNVDSSKNVSNINNITQSGGIKSQGVIETTEDFITAAGKKVQAGYFKFLNTVAEGAGCASDFTNSLTLDSVNQNKFLRCDGTTWVSMLQKGDKGDQGIQGAQGNAGSAGGNSLIPYFYTTINQSLDTIHLCDYTIPAVFSSDQLLNGKHPHTSHVSGCNRNNTWTLRTFAFDTNSETTYTGEWVILNKSAYGHVETLEKGTADIYKHFPRKYSCDDYFAVITSFQQYNRADNMQAYTACNNNYHLSIVNGLDAYATFGLFEKFTAGYAGEKTVSVYAGAKTESSEFNCREYVPLLSEIKVNDLGRDEGPEYVAFCKDNKWTFRVYFPALARTTATAKWVFVRNPRL